MDEPDGERTGGARRIEAVYSLAPVAATKGTISATGGAPSNSHTAHRLWPLDGFDKLDGARRSARWHRRSPSTARRRSARAVRATFRARCAAPPRPCRRPRGRRPPSASRAGRAPAAPAPARAAPAEGRHRARAALTAAAPGRRRRWPPPRRTRRRSSAAATPRRRRWRRRRAGAARAPRRTADRRRHGVEPPPEAGAAVRRGLRWRFGVGIDDDDAGRWRARQDPLEVDEEHDGQRDGGRMELADLRDSCAKEREKLSRNGRVAEAAGEEGREARRGGPAAAAREDRAEAVVHRGGDRAAEGAGGPQAAEARRERGEAELRPRRRVSGDGRSVE